MKRMSRSLWFVVAGVAAIVALNLGVLAKRAPAEPPAADRSTGASGPVIAAPGVVEPRSESIRIASQVGGKLLAVLVDEGDSVVAGQVLAELINDDYKARVAGTGGALGP